MTTPAGRLTIKDIAALTGFTRAAVSNWRARHDDFPAPTADSPARRPLFDLDEVISWLATKDLLPEDAAEKQAQVQLQALMNTVRGVIPPTELVPVLLYLVALRKQAVTNKSSSAWQEIVAATTREELVQVLKDSASPTGAPLSESVDIAGRIRNSFSDQAASGLVAGIDELKIKDYGQAAQLIIDAFLGLGGRGRDSEFGTSKSASSALLVNAASTTTTPGGIIFDPACGIGGALLGLNKRIENLTIVGNDINPWAVAIAELHAYLADVPATFTRSDSLSHDLHEHLHAMTIVIEPPLSMRIDRDIQQELLVKAGIDVPGTLSSEESFLLYALTHLAPGGQAYILTGLGTGFRRQSTQLRQSLVAHGVVEAVLQLPPKLLSYSGIPTLLWVLRSPDPTPDATVLIADASEVTSPETQVHKWLTDMRAGRDTSIPSKRLTLAELITNDGTLVPAQLLREEPDQQEVHNKLRQSVSELSSTLELLQKTQAIRDELFDEFPTATDAASLQQLIDANLLIRHRGTYRSPKKDSPDSTGVSARLVPLRSHNGTIKEVRVPENTLWLEDQDILIPEYAGAPARVFNADDSRWVAPTEMTILRVTDSQLDPHYLVACINASFNEAANLGTVIQRRDFQQIAIPNLAGEHQTEIAGSLTKLADLQATAERLSQQVTQTVDAAMNLVRYGDNTN